ncbi:MAG: Hsp33 family molecular chaperone HslO [Rhodospirillales bacterium]|nr:Hsp33 family molecular chaperone HslO [Rhodospirillales bacterium]
MTQLETTTSGSVDLIQPFQVEGPGLRGRMVRIGPSLKKALTPHDYPAIVAELLGQTVATALILASSLKYDGIFTLQTSSDGPIGTLMADVTSEGAFRCYARYDADKVSAATDENPVASLPHYLGAGHMTFTVDQGPDTERYQGVTELTGASMVDCAHTYFRQSEQLQTAMVILADANTAMAGAVMIQQLPEQKNLMDEDDEDENWRRAVALMSSVKQEELLDAGLKPSELLFRLFHEEGVRLFDPQSIRNECRCSYKKVEQTLKSFPRADIEEMQEQGVVSVTCEFCKTDYNFDHAALDALYSAQDNEGDA